MGNASHRIFTFTDDFVFKYIFGREQQEKLLIKLLNALLHREGSQQIVDLEILNPFNPKETASAKASVVDVKARDGTGRRYLIEVQVKNRPDQIARSLFYLARLYADQLGEGEAYEDLCAATAITLTGYRLFRHHHRVQSRFRMRETELGFELSDLLELHYIELSKVAEMLRRRHSPPVGASRLEGEAPEPPWLSLTRFEKWLYILRYGRRFAGEGPVPPAITEEDGIVMAIDELRKINADRELRQLLEQQEKERRELNSSRFNPRKAYQVGKREGLQQGLQEGLQQGLHQGRQEGMAQIIRQLIASGMPPEEVARRLALPLETVTRLAAPPS
ncbi:MAG: hypothetical protein OZSIB_2565 [Candidatus Ozemobacter sibiricus]|uniref:Rpn family recombination-promoting nuclease/putative transposase n=1 Tax=Candidatus Ozemobacter sibiricus TaxID=2268124 RepID=A0A367ZSS6_9BACT|nr:MAG: hypothetical protein OZSIB_2565 [Candidatus Ozemobacter sibiricus]